jgi:DNA-binding GntR family transcriptional regulator
MTTAELGPVSREPTVGLGPVSRESTAAIIASRLRAAIRDGALRPGGQLGEVELARRFEVSRGTLREAMQRLVEEGLLHGERHRGLFVCDLSSADVLDIYLTRNAIEQTAARIVIRADREAVAGSLAAVYADMEEAAEHGDHTGVGNADARFHEILVSSSGSRRLTRVARTLLIESSMCIHALQDSYELAGDRLSEHGAIVEAIRNGNEALAVGLIDAHMEDAVQRLAPGHSLHGPFAPTA